MARISGVSVTTVSVAEALVLDGVTAGAVTASKAVVVDANKDIGDFRNVDAVNMDAGASGTAGTVDVFPTTAAKGKIALVATDNTGDTITTITNAAQSATATMTIPDTNGAASFVMTAAAQTLAGVKTFSSGIAFGAAATFDADHANTSATGNDTTQSATVTKQCGTITTGALTTAAGASTAVVLTLTGVTAGDPVFVTMCGGTNTKSVVDLATITTTNTITVTLRNFDLLAAADGTVKFNYFWMKA